MARRRGKKGRKGGKTVIDSTMQAPFGGRMKGRKSSRKSRR